LISVIFSYEFHLREDGTRGVASKDKNEIDFIVENDTHILAIEVKSSQTARVDDFRHIISFDLMVTDKKVVGIVLYFGQNVVRFKEKFWAVPMRVFF
jgi:predicted AAA+ superfamily ATPase